MAGGGDHPGVLYFYSESIGLGANGVCVFISALANLGVFQPGLSQSNGLLFLFIGGIAQLLCSVRAYRVYDHFGGTAFGFYAAFWALLGLELLLSSSIGLLHISLIVIGVLLIIIAPLVNPFYTCLVASITVASSLEFALRVVNQPHSVKIAAAVSELFVVLVTSYGTVSAILHGIHERQVLPGFDDAMIETVLWKRRALKSKYSDGKWANPLPLGSISCAMGFAGLAVRWQGSWNAVNNTALTLWLSTFAVLLDLVSLLHGLRHERIWAVSSICDTCLFTVSAASAGEYESVDSVVLIIFAVVRLLLLGFAVAEKISLMHLATFTFQAISLLVVGIASFFFNTEAEVSTISSTFYVTSSSALYSGVAELANAIVQKELFPTGEGFSLMSRFCKSCHKEPGDEESEPSSQSMHHIRLGGNQTDIKDPEEHARSNFQRTPEDDEQSDHKYPGDHQVLGHSDFQSPLFVMITGISLYSIVLSMGIFASSQQLVLAAALLLLVTQASTLLICTSRGQTCFGFLSFTYSLEGIVLMLSHFLKDKTPQHIMIIVLILQAAWLLASFRVFRILSVSTVAHLTGLLLYTIEEINPGAAALHYVAGIFFILTWLVSSVTLGLLLGSDKSFLCRQILQQSAADTEELCEIGFASDREQFDECIRILKEGGVCCIPTDTVYCLACAANSPEAIKRIYDIKKRPSEKPLSLWLRSIEDIKNVAPEGKGWSPKLFAFMDAIWPGSVSLVVSRGSWLQRMGVGSSADLIGTADSIALRVPNSTLTVALLKETGPLAITSANPSGACDCTHHNKVDDLITSKIDYILADGASPMTIASSVVDVRNVDDNQLFFYRVGCVPESHIWSKLINTKEEVPLRVDIHRVNVTVIKSFMSQMIRLVSCDTYKIYMLVRERESSAADDISFMMRPWGKMDPRIQSAFISGIPYYGDEIQQDQDENSQMVVPMLNTRGKTVAVLQLLNKVSNGAAVPFAKNDLAYMNLVSTFLSENLSIKTVNHGLCDWMQSTTVAFE